jgi:hypothetical protein
LALFYSFFTEYPAILANALDLLIYFPSFSLIKDKKEEEIQEKRL